MKLSPRHALLAIPLLASSLSACEEPPPPPRFPVTFTAVSDPGRALPAVSVTANGAPIGQTDANGSLRVDLTGPEGSPVQIAATCPEGHRQPTGLPMLTLRRVESLDPAVASRGIQVSIACPPTQRYGVLLVRAAGEEGRADLPVMIDGREVARTDPSGVAHVPLEMEPGSSFRVLLATADQPLLRPQDPARTFTFPDTDELFVFDQAFEQEAPPRTGRRRRTRRAHRCRGR